MEKDLYLQIDNAIVEAKELAKNRNLGMLIPDFDIRGKLYDLALRLAPEARKMDIDEMKLMIQPSQGEVAVDIAAGTGLLTIPLAEWTKSDVYAVDPSIDQLSVIENLGNPKIHTMLGSPDDEDILSKLPVGQVDIVTSYGGLHHVDNQPKMFENIDKMLKRGGRMVAGDVENMSPLSKHFDTFVARKCITGHTANWLDEERIKSLISKTDLELTEKKNVPIKWVFNSRKEMAYFFKGLHAYDLSVDEICEDLSNALGHFRKDDGKIILDWPMMFFELRKK